MKRFTALKINSIQSTVVNTLSPKLKTASILPNSITTVELDALTGLQIIEASYNILGDGATQYGKFRILKDSITGTYSLLEDLANKVDYSSELNNESMTLLDSCVTSNSKTALQVQNSSNNSGTLNLSYLIINVSCQIYKHY